MMNKHSKGKIQDVMKMGNWGPIQVRLQRWTGQNLGDAFINTFQDTSDPACLSSAYHNCT